MPGFACTPTALQRSDVRYPSESLPIQYTSSIRHSMSVNGAAMDRANSRIGSSPEKILLVGPWKLKEGAQLAVSASMLRLFHSSLKWSRTKRSTSKPVIGSPCHKGSAGLAAARSCRHVSPSRGQPAGGAAMSSCTESSNSRPSCASMAELLYCTCSRKISLRSETQLAMTSTSTGLPVAGPYRLGPSLVPRMRVRWEVWKPTSSSPAHTISSAMS